MMFDEWLIGQPKLIKELDYIFRECWQAAQREERERCAKIAESSGIYGHTVSQATAKAIAEAIWKASSKRAI